ncbi:glycosyltransferase family 92 protein Os08g0121900-like [Triticum dicoccoides]|uniref:glycosyltransferase family 92 protein Os08g0121900-like n=1 Tax=Triticum dicoccoides TaxID=85692 RepID=UPI0018919FEF|nr:glycosyltransferase family 92 protein Os08g0121900-like [Triticum dicoccoides]
MQLHARRRHAVARCRLLIAAAAVAMSLAAVLCLSRVDPAGLLAAPARALQLVPPRRLHVRLGAVKGTTATATPAAGRKSRPPPLETEAVLLPDWEVLVLLRPGAQDDAGGNATCAFGRGASSPARALGKLPASGRRAYLCVVPVPARSQRRLRAPRLVISSSSSSKISTATSHGKSPEILRWSGRLVYESAVVHGGDVLVFAKGVNPRQGVNRAASDVRCVYYRRAGAGAGDAVVASLPAATSAQQVFRCPPPPTTAASQELRVTLAVAGEDPLPSLAVYTPPRSGSSTTPAPEKKLICACTMVRDVAKFLPEWVVYHAAVGVDRFYLYDNGSEDDLEDQVHQLNSAGYNISTVTWPWAKAQEAGFSHGAAVLRDSCEWVAFIDVDEFIFSPRWNQTETPTESMLRSVVSSAEPDIGRVSMRCADFGPSGQTSNPKEGVTQGYTCRRRVEERHKSLLRLDAADDSLLNSIHHFTLRPGFRVEWSKRVRVNHYKYQAWEEFKVKFRRRVSTYVADWTDPVNLQSKDRTPGLGFEAVEPVGWTHKFCEVNDTLLHDTTRRWFGVGFGNNLTSVGHSSSSS